MFKSLLGVASDVVEIVATPVVIAAGVASVVTAPVAQMAREIREGVQSLTDPEERDGR